MFNYQMYKDVGRIGIGGRTVISLARIAQMRPQYLIFNATPILPFLICDQVLLLLSINIGNIKKKPYFHV